jgi:hypothetical protein
MSTLLPVNYDNGYDCHSLPEDAWPGLLRD